MRACQQHSAALSSGRSMYQGLQSREVPLMQLKKCTVLEQAGVQLASHTRHQLACVACNLATGSKCTRFTGSEFPGLCGNVEYAVACSAASIGTAASLHRGSTARCPQPL